LKHDHKDINRPLNDILVVDDNPDNLRLLSNLFTDQGYKVRPAPSSEMALRSVESIPPDIILLDINMPEIDGFEICQRLKKDDRSRDIPVIFISGRDETKDKIRAFESGGVDYITKPFHEEEVLARVKTHIELHTMQLRLEEMVRERTADLTKSNEKLRQTELEYRSLVENANEAILVTQDEVIKFFNSQTLSLTGYSDDELSSIPFITLIHPEDREKARRGYEERISDSPKPSSYILRINTKSGQLKWVLINAAQISWEGFPASLAMVTDITLWKESEGKLIKSEERFRAFVENSSEAIWCYEFKKPLAIDLQVEEQIDHLYKYAYIVDANDAHARMLGYELGEELVGFSLEDTLPRSLPGSIASLEQFIMERYNLVDLETVETSKHGEQIVFSSNIVGIIEDGHLLRVWGTNKDITEQKKIEQKLIDAERKYRTVANFTYSWEYWEAPEGGLEYVSPSCERITGYSVTDFMERPELISEIIIPEDRAIWNDHDHGSTNNTETTPSECHFRIKNKNGHIRWIAHICQSVYNEQGDQGGVRVSNRDITELRNTEQKVLEHRDMLLHLERRETLGQLAGSIAHELNQPLTGILGDAQAGELLLKKEKFNKAQLREIFAGIAADTKRASLVIRNLRELFSMKKTDYNHVNINTLIRETLQILNSEFIIQSVTIHTDYSSNLPNVDANRIQLQQVLINLIKNSCQAMLDSEKKDRLMSITTSVCNDDQVAICLEDNGPGIDPDQLQSIFEPLTTTKEDGMGMGLAISRSIVQAHGGEIWAENNPNGGIRFHLTIPAQR